MSRTRAERRHNTHVKTSRRKALAVNDGNPDLFPADGYCGRMVSKNGEACSCSLCETNKRWEDWYGITTLAELREREWTRVNLTDYNTNYPS